MTRVFAIVGVLAALLGVLATSAAYAVPMAVVVSAPIAAPALCDAPTELTRPPALAGRFCVKRHSLGLPCGPQPLLLPMAAAFWPGPMPVEAGPPPPVLRVLPDAPRHFRPPRPALA
jgi:hypothetical protein